MVTTKEDTEKVLKRKAQTEQRLRKLQGTIKKGTEYEKRYKQGTMKKGTD